MAGSIFLRSTQTAIGEQSTTIQIEIVRSGALSGEVLIQYAVTPDSATPNSATPGIDFTGTGGSVVMPDGASSVFMPIQILNDGAGEPTEAFTVALTGATGATLVAPRTHRVAILDDETPAPPPPAEPPLVSPYDVTLAPVIRGLDQPIRFILAPGDPQTVLIAERAGIVRAVNMATGADATVLDIRDVTNFIGERGLADIAVHPDFAAHPYLYAAYTVDPPDAAQQSGEAGPDGSGNRYMHVARYTLETAGGMLRAVPGSGVVILGAGGQALSDISGGGAQNFTDPAHAAATASDRIADGNDRVIGGFKQDYVKVDSLSHAAGRLLFGPDGMLYVTTGDGSSYFYPDLRAADVQSLDSLSGKVLRIDPLTGRGLADNPFAAAAEDLDANRAKIFQYGLRNPFSASFDAEGRLFLADVGWFAFEELNVAGPGANFGWPYFEGGDAGAPLATPQHRDQPGAAAFYAAVAAGDVVIAPPFRAFGHAPEEPGFQMQAILMGTYIADAPLYPAALHGHLLFSDYIGGNLFSVDTNNRDDLGFIFDWPGARGPLHMLQAPDGQILYADMGTGQIGRLGIAEASATPTARLSIAPATPAVLEGNSGTTEFAFTVTRTGAITEAFSIGWSVEPGITIGAPPADAGDFVGGVLPSGTIAFAAGQATAQIRVPIAGDGIGEGNEHFQVTLATPPANAMLQTTNATGTIFDDDGGLSTLSIAALTPSRPEGTGGATLYTFAVTRLVSSTGAISARWTAAGFDEPGTVPAEPGDFPDGKLPTGIVSFADGQTSATITVAVATDSLGELNERFAVTLSDPSPGAAISKATVSAIIFNDDANLAIAPLAQSYVEGDSGMTSRVFTVTRTGATFASTVDWSVGGFGDRPAEGLDFIGFGLPSGSLAFAPGEASRAITVDLVNDTFVEPDESFAVTLSNPSAGTTLTEPQAVVTILGDDTQFGIVPLDARRDEGTGGTTTFAFLITRSGGSQGVMSVDWAAQGIAGNGTMPATADDFAGGAFPSGTATFAPGEITKLVTMEIAADARRELNERFAVDLSPSPGASIGLGRAHGFIMNDDVSLAITAAAQNVPEGNAGTTPIVLTVTRAGILSGATTVDWSFAPGGLGGTLPVTSADFAANILPTGDQLSFAPGETTQRITLSIAGDTAAELNESFTVSLLNPGGGAQITRGMAQLAVMDDDTILGTSGDDTLAGTPGPDLFIIGTGHDSIAGGAGRDQFRLLPSSLGAPAANSFTFTDFSRAAGEILDLTRIDAIAGTPADDPFTFIGTAAFAGIAGQLRWQDQGTHRLLQGDVNGDGIADLTIRLTAPGPISPGWFGP